MASLELEQDFIPFSQFPASQNFGPDSSQHHINPIQHPMLKAFFDGLKHKRSKTKKGSFKITNSRNYSDQPRYIPIMNSWERRIHRNHLVYFDSILLSVEPLIPPPVTQLSPDASVLFCFVDGRLIKFEDALLLAVEVSPSRGKFTFSLHPTHPLSPGCPYLNKTFGLMIGMKGVQGVRVSWKLSYTFSPKAIPRYYTNGTYEQGEGDEEKEEEKGT
ncbi:hypothetical protein QJS10_CPB13g01420 [Acorus calamus]|uniref:Uncharacterized protein n=1 Tax=Acorus calamus TaxID=4465 RepID=A0AAV9DGI6_ACOCL|nr:hypothetical protein QJS10_CPB13g01420 [Acorus calamus]